MKLLLLLTIPLLAFAQSFEMLEKKLQEIRVLKASFIQRVRYPWYSKQDISKGFFYAQKGGKFRLEYEQPEKTIIVSDGREIVLYSPSEKSAIIDSIDRNQSAVIESLLLVSRPLSEVFDLVGEIEKEGKRFLVLKPKTKDDFFHRVLVRMDQDGIPRVIRVEEKDGTTTEIELLDVNTNFTASSNLFKIDLPSGTKIKRVF
ncbi:outer membrane lipoprotein chaperone LolA [Thermocrinis sp.]|uniref:outer membrane lipoprotein chaperone LolA n=1 Tax=Thermocrinis sp. TaxID=2024383 RepID=UPI002FDD1100